MSNQAFPMSYIKAQYLERNPQGHWFEPSTMRFFHTRLPRTGYMSGSGLFFFVTSESQGYGHPRRYSIRCMELNGAIRTIGDFHSYPNQATALASLKAMLKQPAI